MKTTAIGLAALAIATLLSGTALGADPMLETRIGKMLAGNSIIHPTFGCVFYGKDGTTLQFGQGIEPIKGKWAVEGDIYYSTGQCGRSGCELIGDVPNLTFRRLDGKYEQPAILIRGNYCEKDGILS